MVATKEGRRQARVAEAIRAELAVLLVKQTGDPRLFGVTITEVDVTPDLRQARVFFVATGVPDQAPVIRSIEKATPFLQREIGRNLRLRFTPKLLFSHDDSFDKAERIDRLVAEVSTEQTERLSGKNPEKKLARLVDEAASILIATHANPDGDAIGSLLGMSAILSLLGKAHVAYCPDGVPKVLSFLPGVDTIVKKLEPEFKADLTILLDTADDGLFPEGFPDADRRGTLVVIDHHMQHGRIGDLVIRREASAVGEMLFDLARELVWPIDASAAECLYTSIMSDTGSFRYSSTTPSAHRAAADLIAMGADPWKIASALYESFPLRRQVLLGEVARTLKVSDDGRFASLLCTPEMLERTGATKADLDGIINIGRAIEGVEISALFRMQSEGEIKVSFRSKGKVDVGALCARFGGGGHRNAAGCTIKGEDLAKTRDAITKTVDRFFAEHDASDSVDQDV